MPFLKASFNLFFLLLYYRLYTVLPRLMKFIDNLTNWYVRTNRKRLKGEGNSTKDCRAALDTLFSVLFTMVRVFAPFTPFLTEHMYQKLKHLGKAIRFMPTVLF